MSKYSTLFLTHRSAFHQRAALESAPPELEITLLRDPDRREVLALLPEMEFLISERSGVVDAEMIAAAPHLRLIQRLGSLTYDIDLEAARAAGVPVCAVPVHGAIMVAEHLVMQMLALLKRLHHAERIALEAGDWGVSRRTDENTFAYNWSGLRGIAGLQGKTVGVLGFGEIGAELARRLRPFRPAQVLYYKRHRLPSHAEAELDIVYCEPPALYAESDILAMLLPYTPATDELIDASVFEQMRPSAYLVSCGSGSVIDEAALAEAIRSGQIAGAALDTFEWEPLRPDNPLLSLARERESNILLTPHVAAGSPAEGETKSSRRAEDYANLIRVLRGEPLRHRVV
ncbi:MAG: 2-hydroxyacid dehydrogenase [Anaerolineae bacterium]